MNFKKHKSGFSFLLIACCILLISLSSCIQLGLYEKNSVIPDGKWKSSYEVKGSFEIKDSTSKYTIYLVLRHRDAYKYNNIWLNVGLQNPGDSMFYQKIDVQLGNDATGWKGSGMNDIWELREPLFFPPKPFKKTGTYNFSIKQIMRDDPLPGVMSAGLRLEKQD